MIPIFKTKRLWTVSGAVLLATGFAVAGTAAMAEAACSLETPRDCNRGVGLSLTLEGCRISDAPDGFNLQGNNFRCDGAGYDYYTTGNIRPGFNELDLVPHRLTIATTGSFTPNTQEYIVSIGHDSILNKSSVGSFKGYDLITIPTLRPESSGCAIVEVGDERVEDVGVGGVDKTIFRDLVIRQTKGGKCILDWQARLAVSAPPDFLGAGEFSGSSLQSQVVTGSGSKTVPIPVSSILPQSIRKTLQATLDASRTWNLTQGPQNATVDFGDSCATQRPLSQEITFRVEWKIVDTIPGQLNLLSTVYAKNPANRDVAVQIQDDVSYNNGIILSKTGNFVTVPAGTGDVPVLEINEAIEPPDGVAIGDTIINNAVATYRDIIYPDQPIPGQRTAQASAQVEAGALENETVDITNTEEISGTGLTFSVDSTYPVGLGEFTSTTGTRVDWQLLGQSTDGFVEFNKIIYLDQPQIIFGTSAVISETSTLTGSDGFGPVQGTVSVNINANASVTLTINKTLEYPADQPYTFTFDVCKDNGAGACDGDVIETKQVEFAAGESADSVDVTGLEPGVTYRITEVNIPEPWVATPSSQTAMVNLPNCSGEVTFQNTVAEAGARAVKVTEPGDFMPKDWTFSLYRVVNGTPEVSPIDSGSSNDGIVEFGVLAAGTYQIVETPRDNWDPTRCGFNINSNDPVDCVSPTICEFNVSYPANAGDLFTCTFTNTQRGRIIIKKETLPKGSTQGFGFAASYDDDDFSLADGESNDSGYLVPGDYTAQELIPADWNWDLIGLTCIEDKAANSTTSLNTATASIKLDPGETVECTFTNRERSTVVLNKTVSGLPPVGDESFAFDIRTGADLNSTGTVVASATVDASNNVNVPFGCVAGDPPCRRDPLGQALLVPGDYQLCETGLMPGWTTSLALAPGYFVPSGNSQDADNSVYCIPFTLGAGDAVSFDVDNTPPPGGDARTIGFWKNWTSCDGHGNQDPVLDETLALCI